MRFSAILQSAGLVLAALCWQSPASAFQLEGEAIQGGLMFGSCQPGCRVTLDGSDVLVSPEGRFVIGFDRDETGERTLAVTDHDGSTQSRTLTVGGREYDIERVDGLPPQTVTPDPEDMSPHWILNAPIGHLVPYVTAGIGLVHSGEILGLFQGSATPLFQEKFGTRFAVNYGGGLKFSRLAGPLGLRIDVRGYTLPDVFSNRLNLFEVSGGLMISF